MPNNDLQLCRLAVGQLVTEDPDLVLSLLDDWTAEAHVDGDIGTADALLDLRPCLVRGGKRAAVSPRNVPATDQHG